VGLTWGWRGVAPETAGRQEGRMAKVFHFGDFTLDTAAFEMRRGSEIIPVEPLVLDLITLLLEQPGVVLSRDNLVESVWKGRLVSESTVSTAIKWARKTLGDTGRDQKYIRTIRGRGIQLAVPVEAAETAVAGSPAPIPGGAMQPTIYVRPFEAMGDADLEHLSRALRIRTGSILARIPLLRIASAFPQADEPMDPRELRSRFEITHVLEVRLQRNGNMLTADAALTETRNGLQIWAEQLATPAGAGEQEILLHKMIRRVEPRMMQAMAAEMQTDGGEPGARSNLMQAMVLLALKGWHRTTFVEATGLIERAIEQEPDLALPHAYLALIQALGHRVGVLRDDGTIVASVIAAVNRALELESQDSTILGLVGCALADVGQVDRALLILRKAIEANPQNGHAKTALGSAFLMKRDYTSAVRYLSEGIDCSPADSRRAVWGAALALAQLALGELDDALESAESACREDDRLYLSRLALAAVHLARKDQVNAAAAVQECVRTKPDLTRGEVTCVVGETLGDGVWAIAQALMDRGA
jgi:DNA-binding winged helix-turn-helix (wHTH) protein/tetratricopeptide (TPR) repeat protein